MKINLAYGKTGTAIEMPEGLDVKVLDPRWARPLDDVGWALAVAMAEPTAGPALSELARGKKTAAISVCDITRPAPNRVVLPHVIRALEQGGIAAENVRILIATGLHREATDTELDEIVGPEMRSKCRVDSHRARELDEQTHLGDTDAGTPVYIDKRFVEADVHITLGFIEPHLMAGFSGGRKLISIGLAGERTIKKLHSPLYMRDPDAVEGVFPANPLHRELIEIARRARHDFMVDVALNGNREIAAIFTGEPEEAHAKGVEFVRRSTLAAVGEEADAVITTSGGYPLDLTYYQSVKGITAAAHIVRKGGEILLVGECSEGLGGPEFSEMLRTSPDWRALLDSFENAEVRVDQWQLEKLAMVAAKAKLSFCVPNVSAEDRKILWGPSYDTPQEAVDKLAASLPHGARVVVIPEGPYVFSQLEPEPVAAD